MQNICTFVQYTSHLSNRPILRMTFLMISISNDINNFGNLQTPIMLFGVLIPGQENPLTMYLTKEMNT